MSGPIVPDAAFFLSSSVRLLIFDNSLVTIAVTEPAAVTELAEVPPRQPNDDIRT